MARKAYQNVILGGHETPVQYNKKFTEPWQGSQVTGKIKNLVDVSDKEEVMEFVGTGPRTLWGVQYQYAE